MAGNNNRLMFDDGTLKDQTVDSTHGLPVSQSVGGAVVSNTNPLPTRPPEDSVALTKTSVTMTGASAALVAASGTRKVVIVSNTDTNSPAAVDPTGGTCALDAGIPILPGATIKITGVAAQSAMTQIGTNTQKLTVYTG